MLKLYLSQKSVIKNQKLNAFPLLSEFYNTENQAFDCAGGDYGKLFVLTENIDDADFVVLTHSLNFYHDNNLSDKIPAFVEEARRANKIGWAYSSGDYGFKFSARNVYYFRTSAYESRLNEFDVIMPDWTKDPYNNDFLNLQFAPCAYKPVPRVGFCGQSSNKFGELLKTVYQLNVHNLKSRLALHGLEANKQFYSALHRKRILDKFKKSRLLDCRFIEREQYRAGIGRRADKFAHRTTREYYDNIFNNLYTVAIRGGGNFSRRFFDVCAVGRIPIFVNCDSPIPFKEKLAAKNLLVEIDPNDCDFDRKILNYHRSIERDAAHLQSEMRRFWQEHYTKSGFYKQIHDCFAEKAEPSRAIAV